LQPPVHLGLQEVERDRAAGQQLVVERAQVEARAQRGGRLRPQLLDLQLADLVGQGLPRPDVVAVDLHLDVVLGLARVLLEVAQGLVP
jgi:hypothetical protein